MRYVEAPEAYDGSRRSLFIAGGITGCANWQRSLVDLLQDTALVLLNPRRTDFALDDPTAAAVQIAWEHHHLRKATAISFWFPAETLCPIVLYELGAWSMTDKRLFVGTHPAYQRRQDVFLQTGLVRPDVSLVLSLPALAAQIRKWDRP